MCGLSMPLALIRGIGGPLGEAGANGCRPIASWFHCARKAAARALLLAREQSWSEGDVHLMTELAEGYAYAWLRCRGRRRRSLVAALFGRGLVVKLALAAALVAVLCLPVTLSALAPAEVVALQPTIVRAPLEGAVDHFEVQPNEHVEAGQLLLTLDPRAIENKLGSPARRSR